MLSTNAVSHVHELSIDDALDFLDTIELEAGVQVDHFTSAADAIEWMRGRSVVHDPCEPGLEALESPGPAADRALRRIRSVRAALREVVDATAEERAPAATSLDVVNRAMAARQRLVLVVRPADATEECPPVVLDHRHEGDPLDEALGRIAERIAREASGANAHRLRICANDRCQWAFYDSSRTGRRRWCDMASCGNRAKAARHRARARAAGSPPTTEAVSAAS